MLGLQPYMCAGCNRRCVGCNRTAGALVVNIVAFYAGPHVALAKDVVRTLRGVFSHVRCFVDRPPHLSPEVRTVLNCPLLLCSYSYHVLLTALVAA